MGIADLFRYEPQDFQRMRSAVAEDPGWKYGSVLPLRGRGEGDTAELQFAMPGFVRDTARGLIDLLEGPYTGQMTPEATMALPSVTGLGGMFAPAGALGAGPVRIVRGQDPFGLMRRAGGYTVDGDAIRHFSELPMPRGTGVVNTPMDMPATFDWRRTLRKAAENDDRKLKYRKPADLDEGYFKALEEQRAKGLADMFRPED